MAIKYIKMFISISMVLFFGIVVPLLFVKGEFSLPTIILQLIILYSVIRLASSIMKKDQNILEVTFLIFVYVFLGLVPLIQSHNNQFAWSGDYTDMEIILTSLTILLGLISYDIGIYFGNKKFYSFKKVDRKLNFKFLLLLSISCFFLSFIQLGGIQGLQNATDDMSSSNALIIKSLLRAPVFVCLMFSLFLYSRKKNKSLLLKENFKFTCLISILLFLNFIASNPMYTSRYWFGTVVISCILVSIKWRSLTQPLLALTIIFSLIVIFPYADGFRNSDHFELQTTNITSVLSDNGDFDAFQQIMNTRLYTDIYEYTYGKQLVGSLLFFIPRSIWSEKPIGTGAMVGEGLGYNFTNISAPLWAEFYVFFGNFTVIILFVAYGILTSYLQNKYNKTKDALNFVRIFVPIFAIYQIFLLRGDLLSTFAFLAPVILFILISFKPRIKY